MNNCIFTATEDAIFDDVTQICAKGSLKKNNPRVETETAQDPAHAGKVSNNLLNSMFQGMSHSMFHHKNKSQYF